MAKHSNYEFIVAFAEGKEVEFKYCDSGEWFNIEYLNELDEHRIFRIKPKTRMINGFEVPFAMDKELSHGQDYFYPHICESELYGLSSYYTEWDRTLFQRGLCFSNKKDAIAVAKAMLGIDPNS